MIKKAYYYAKQVIELKDDDEYNKFVSENKISNIVLTYINDMIFGYGKKLKFNEPKLDKYEYRIVQTVVLK